MPEYMVTSEHADKRLDHVLIHFMERSRSQIQKLIKAGEITVNGKPATPHLALEEGDLLFYPQLEPCVQHKVVGPVPILEVLFEDDDLVVINKPAGLIVHRAHELDSDPSVVDALLERYPFIHEVGDDPTRPGIVHRLDKDVSGLMVVAKTNNAFLFLKKQFQDRTVKKEYLALVYGQLPKTHDRIELKIARSKVRGRMVARTQEQEGKEAITEYTVLKLFKVTTYVRVNILTGRTHQIRVHFRAIDHPLVGDKLYKKTHMKNIRPIELDRIFLHANLLTIKLLNDQERTCISPLPDALEQILKLQPTL